MVSAELAAYPLGLEVAVILFVAILGLFIARKFGQPVVLGEILLGVLIGPALLNIVKYDAIVEVLAELGAVFLLFSVGLKSDYRKIYTMANTWVALVGVIVPYFAGWWLARAFGYTSLESIFIGVALTATSIAITAQVLAEHGVLQKDWAQTILGAAVVDDIISLLAISVLTGIGTNFSWVAMIWQVLLVIGFFIGALLLQKPVKKLILKVDKEHSPKGLHKITIFSAMIVCFGYAGIAELIGLSSIVGAFLAGVSIPKPHPPSLQHGSDYFTLFFASIFFVSLGILVDIHSLEGSWLFALFLALIAILTKFIGCFVSARTLRYKVRESFAIGAGMVPRGEVTMIVGLIGLTRGSIGTNAYSVIILVAFITTVVAAPMLSMMIPHKTHL